MHRRSDRPCFGGSSCRVVRTRRRRKSRRRRVHSRPSRDSRRSRRNRLRPSGSCRGQPVQSRGPCSGRLPCHGWTCPGRRRRLRRSARSPGARRREWPGVSDPWQRDPPWRRRARPSRSGADVFPRRGGGASRQIRTSVRSLAPRGAAPSDDAPGPRRRAARAESAPRGPWPSGTAAPAAAWSAVRPICPASATAATPAARPARRRPRQSHRTC